MARPLKKGLDYFPLDVNIDGDDKLKILEGLYGIVGFGVVIKVLMKIYDNGFYYEWREIEPILMAERTKVDIETVKDIIKNSVKYGLFSEKLYNDYQILSSIGIQKRYFTACGKRKKGEAEREYLLLSEEEVLSLCPKIALISVIQGITNINQGKSKVIQEFSTQSKVKESKVNKSKVNSVVLFKNKQLNDTFNEFVEYRKKSRSTMTERAIELMVKKLDSLTEKSPNPVEDKIEILNQSILNGWKGIFPISKNNSNFSKNKKEVGVPDWYEDYEKQLKGQHTTKEMTPEEQEKMTNLVKDIVG
jgi:hypothetical protein